MDIMDTARFNIKKHREWKGLRQQDLADKLSMNLRSYQNLESGATKLDLERLAQIADVLETTTEDLLRPEGYYIHQEIKEGGNGPGVNFGSENTYNYGIKEELLNRLLAEKDEEIRYLKEKVDQLLEMVGKKG
jgi:transcriptional regulator with XRE-family HTH domain